MSRLIRLVSAALAGAALLVTAPAVASGGSTTTCSGTLPAGTYVRLVVPAGSACFIQGPVTVNGGLFVEPGATLVLGSDDNPSNSGTINGGVHATNAASVQIHFATINGGIDIRGGSGPFGGPFGVTWNEISRSHISGNVTMSGYDGFWIAFIENHVNGSVNLNNNVVVDPDGNEYVTNTIHGSLNCSGNSPAPQIGDSGGSPNTVTGPKTGQCASL
jgi:hypothetical protein